MGFFHWTDVGYDSALRWWRSSRFLAEKGMGITVGVGLETQEWLTLSAPGGEAPRFITLERRWERNDGGALVALVAHTGDPELPTVRWDNPFCPSVQGQGRQKRGKNVRVGVDGVLPEADPGRQAKRAQDRRGLLPHPNQDRRARALRARRGGTKSVLNETPGAVAERHHECRTERGKHVGTPGRGGA